MLSWVLVIKDKSQDRSRGSEDKNDKIFFEHSDIPCGQSKNSYNSLMM